MREDMLEQIAAALRAASSQRGIGSICEGQ